MATPAASPADGLSDAVEIPGIGLMLPAYYPPMHVQPDQPRQTLPPRWTYSVQHPKDKSSVTNSISPGAPAVRYQVYGSDKDDPVDRSYLERLQPKQWLPSVLVDLYLSEVANAYFEGGDLERFAELCLLPTQVFYSVQETKGRYLPHTLLDQWKSALEHTHIALPMNAHGNHWLLGIITHASDLLEEVNPIGPVRTSFVVLNSILNHNPSNLETRVRQMVNLLAIGKPLRPDGIRRLRFFYPSVPQQPDTCDCGLYPGHFLSVFLSDPSRFVGHCTGGEKIPGPSAQIWKASHIPTARETLRELVESLAVVRRASLTFHSGRTPSDLEART